MVYQTETLSLRTQKKPEPKVYFIVSKNIVKNSTNRNRIKRRFRSAIREILNKKPPKQTLIFYGKKGIESKKYQEIKESIDILLKKSNL